MKKIFICIVALLIFSCTMRQKSYDQSLSPIDNLSVVRYELSVERDLPTGFSLIEALDKGFYIVKFHSNYFLAQVVRSNGTSSGAVSILLTKIDFKEE